MFFIYLQVVLFYRSLPFPAGTIGFGKDYNFGQSELLRMVL